MLFGAMVLLALAAGPAGIADEAAAVVVQAEGHARGPAGLPPARQRLMARRGAEVVAARNLLVRTTPARPSRSGWSAAGANDRIRGVVFGPTLSTPDGTAWTTGRFGP